MCGIAGFIGKGSKEDVERMIASIAYRGPDDRGVFYDDAVGLGHARLSIIDLSSAGHQPMWNSTQAVAIIFNGEIYNFQELRKVCSSHQFKSSSDTEVILALYEQYGEKCFEKLNGMFAIAIYDTTKKKLLLARDRMGKKPLYWGIFEDTFIFGSELKALLAHPLSKKELNLEALNMYFAFDYVPTPHSIFKGIFKLEPGTVLAYENKQVQKTCFWNPDTSEIHTSQKEMLAKLDESLRSAVSSRLVADVPLGIFLSGGLDSSTIAYYATQISREPVHTFSIGFDEASFDESIYAKKVSEHLHTVHHHKTLTSEDSLNIIPKIFASLDEPMADASIIPTYLLSKFAKEHVTVALGGDGGDELFAGYPTFQAEKLVSFYQHMPSLLQKSFTTLVSLLPASEANFGLKFKLQKFLDGANEKDMSRRHLHWLGTFTGTERTQIFTPSVGKALVAKNVFEESDTYFREAGFSDSHNKLLWMYQRTYMMDQVLVKVDRASMRASLETRAPLLDYTLVEWVNRLPYVQKLHRFTTKYLLKKLMEGKLPSDIIYRSKKGFGVPIGAWLRGPLKEWGEELLSPENLRRTNLFAPEYVATLWNEHQEGKADHRKKLWTILVFLEWHKNFFA